jgi:hypothetical protein
LFTGKNWKNISGKRMPNGNGNGYINIMIIREWLFYEEAKTPYFYDKQGSKCAFIYPSKGAGLIIHQAEDSEYYAALTLNKEPMIK